MNQKLLFEKLDINRHNIKACAELIYKTDENLFAFMFKYSKKHPLLAVEEIIKDKKSYFGYPTLYVATDEKQETYKGILSAYKGYSTDFNHFFILKHLTLTGKIRHLLYVLPKLKKAFNPEVCHRDFYISNISVHPDYKRQGVGAFILKNAHKVAEKNYASRILLDVSSENNPALSLYKKHGFTQRGWGLIKAGGKSTKVLWMSKSL